MMDVSKYGIGYYPVPSEGLEWYRKDHIERAPRWCSVDLRDGNQSLIIPMSIDEKLEFYRMLLAIGFKEIEVGFPAASETEYRLIRTLIDRGMIPEDVTVQVLTQCRDHIIRKTFEAIQGAPRAIIHFYNSTSVAQREQVFRMSKGEIMKIATDGARLIKDLSEEYEGNFLFEYSPESFTGTEPDYAVEVCNAVLDIMRPTPERPMIINLPATVEMSLPSVFANQVEWCGKHLEYRDSVILSVHCHNDRGTGVACTELALLAGAQRVESCLFGNGERTGNADTITLAMNMYAQGIDPGLDFSDMPQICKTYEKLTRMHVHPRQPYAGSLVFAAFSGSHQDAIAKGMRDYSESGRHEWNCPYIPIDPQDIGRTYSADVIRINSQSGQGGVEYILEQNYGFVLPRQLRQDFGYRVKDVSDKLHKELSAHEIYEIFSHTYLNRFDPIDIDGYSFTKEGEGAFEGEVTISAPSYRGTVFSRGNGRLDLVSNALREALDLRFTLENYSEHSLDVGSKSRACCYIKLRWEDGVVSWGTGTDTDIIRAGVKAVLSAINEKEDGLARPELD